MSSRTTATTPVFSSAGFDLDDIKTSSDGNHDNVVLELGGGTTTVTSESESQPKHNNDNKSEAIPDLLAPAEEFKKQGNEAFQQQNWELALEHYTAAINAAPPGSLTGDELLKLRDEWMEQQSLEMRRKLNEEEEKRREARRKQKEAETKNGAASAAAQNDDKDDDDEDKQKQEPPPKFKAPPYEHAEKVAVYYCNRAAVLLHLQRYHDAIRDADVAILWNPHYTKAYMRRCTAYEQTDKTDLALADAKAAMQLDPTNKMIQQTVRRLQKLEDERLEKLKTETLDKLKDLGNSILGNFGLSLDNFKAEKDPNTGSYSISFNQK